MKKQRKSLKRMKKNNKRMNKKKILKTILKESVHFVRGRDVQSYVKVHAREYIIKFATQNIQNSHKICLLDKIFKNLDYQIQNCQQNQMRNSYANNVIRRSLDASSAANSQIQFQPSFNIPKKRKRLGITTQVK